MNNLQVYAHQFSEMRKNLTMNLTMPAHRSVLIAYEMLATHVFRIFEIPKNQKKYIMRSFGIPELSNPSSMVSHLIHNNISITESFSLDLPLRGLEVYFSFGEEQRINLSDFSILNILIERLTMELANAKQSNLYTKKTKGKTDPDHSVTN